MTPEDRIQTIQKRLLSFAPDHLEILDESHKHAGHLGNQNGAGHFSIRIRAPAFTGKKRIECHRMIYSVLSDMMEKEIHALQIKIDS